MSAPNDTLARAYEDGVLARPVDWLAAADDDRDRAKYAAPREQVIRLSNITPGSARVMLDGERIGEVRYHERGYNLTRYIVSRWWTAEPVRGARLEGHFASRRDAVAALAQDAAAKGAP